MSSVGQCSACADLADLLISDATADILLLRAKPLSIRAKTSDWKAQAVREGIQNKLAIIGSGPGGIDRLEVAKASGKVALPALAGLGLALTPLMQEEQKREAGQ